MHEIQTFLALAARELGCPYRTELTYEVGGQTVTPHCRRSHSAFITYAWLQLDAQYSYGELPQADDLREQYVADNRWCSSGPVGYDQVAHIIIPRFFSEYYEVWPTEKESGRAPNITSWKHEQNLDGFSEALKQASIGHGLSEYALEIKRF